MPIKYVQWLVLFTFLLAFSLGFFLNWGMEPIGEINAKKDEAAENYEGKKFDAAITSLKNLLQLAPSEEAAQLNLGHSYFLKNDTISKIEYAKALLAQDNFVKSVANQQSGVYLAQYLKNNPNSQNGKQMLDDAIAYSKDALRANPTNEQARYNYELLARLKASNQQNQEQQQQEQNEKDKENKESQDQKENQEKQNENQEKQDKGKQDKEKEGSKTESAADQLEKKNMNKDAAKMILNAMKNSEMQYLQQMKRKSAKAIDKNLPDW